MIVLVLTVTTELVQTKLKVLLAIALKIIKELFVLKLLTNVTVLHALMEVLV
jgi:hypothetical protein